MHVAIRHARAARLGGPRARGSHEVRCLATWKSVVPCGSQLSRRARCRNTRRAACDDETGAVQVES